MPDRPNPRIMQDLVKALRSGIYPQAQGQLRDGNRFCCLGVLCDLHARATGGKWNGNQYLGSATFLPKEVMQWAGFTRDSPTIILAGSGAVPLTHLNDGEGPALYGREPMPFPDLADIIEEHLVKP